MAENIKNEEINAEENKNLSVSSEKKLSKKDLLRCFAIWETVTESCLSYERLMSLGFCHSMVPIIKKLYGGNKEETAKALKRHLVFFNTENNFGAFIPGIVCSMEEKRANGAEDISDDTINAVKAGLMGPLAGVGDTITQGLVRTVLLAIFVDMTLAGNIAAPFIFALLGTAFVLAVGWFTFSQGYKLGTNVFGKITDSSIMRKLTSALSILGLTIAGAMMVNNVSITTPLEITLGETSVVIQELLDSILPGMLSVAFVLFCFFLMRKGMSVFKIMLILFAIAVVCAAFGIL